MSTRGRGRPRNDDCDRAIIAAVLAVVADVGITNFTIDAVALRAGVGRATVYRRWPSKEALALHAWASCAYDIEIPDTGSLRDDLVAVLSTVNPNMPVDLSRRVLPQLLAAAKVDPDLVDTYHEIIDERRRPSRVVLDRAAERGELPPGVDLDLLQEALIGPLYYRIVILDLPIDLGTIEAIVDLVLAGVSAPMASSTG